jgi:hypothetical protein
MVLKLQYFMYLGFDNMIIYLELFSTKLLMNKIYFFKINDYLSEPHIYIHCLFNQTRIWYLDINKYNQQ